MQIRGQIDSTEESTFHSEMDERRMVGWGGSIDSKPNTKDERMKLEANS
jgi:hypothetical protein